MILEREREKYQQIWSFPEYSNYSPGKENVDRFLQVVRPNRKISSIIDIGCGQGGAGLEFQELGFDVTWMDLVDVLSERVDRSRFICSPLWGDGLTPIVDLGDGESSGFTCPRYSYGYCCDVMEHIPPEFTMLCLDRIITACGLSWLQICNLPDQFGEHIGQPLHLTVQPFSWWLERIKQVGRVIDARDLCGNSLFIVEPKP